MKNNIPQNWARLSLEEGIIHVLGGDWGKDFSDRILEGYVKVRVIRGTEFKEWQNEKGVSDVYKRQVLLSKVAVSLTLISNQIFQNSRYLWKIV